MTGDLNCQVAHEADTSLEFFGGEAGSCGTFLAVEGTLYGPASGPSAGQTPWTPASLSAVTGSGSSGDPYRIVTTVDAADTGVSIEQTDSYVEGEESYRTDIRILNPGGADLSVVVYRAADCYLQDSDVGYGRVDDGAPACVISQEDDARIEQWEPITQGSHYVEGHYGEVYRLVSTQASFPDTCACDQQIDNGAGLSWETSVPAGGSTTVSHLTFFSPEGRRPQGVPLRDAVPSITQINLDPVVVASSVALAAGVVVVVPFPAALFNSTLEKNQAEVSVLRRRFTGWLGRLMSKAWSGVRRRASGAGPPAAASAAPDVVVPAAAPSAGTETDLWRTPRGIALFLLLSALLYGLLDPTFGPNLDSLGTFLGLALGLAIMLAAYVVPLWVLTRGQDMRITAAALPATIVIAILCVIVSRVANFQPGYVYGLIIGFGFTRELTRVQEGRVVGIAAAVSLGVAVAAWLLLPLVRGDSAGFGGVMLETAFATVVVAGLEGALFGMLPLQFLPGEAVRAWNPRFWMGLIGVAAFAFFHILLNPSSGYLADSERSSMTTVVFLLVIFGGVSVLFWAYFRFRPPRQVAAAAAAAPPAPAPVTPDSASAAAPPPEATAAVPPPSADAPESTPDESPPSSEPPRSG